MDLSGGRSIQDRSVNHPKEYEQEQKTDCGDDVDDPNPEVEFETKMVFEDVELDLEASAVENGMGSSESVERVNGQGGGPFDLVPVRLVFENEMVCGGVLELGSDVGAAQLSFEFVG